MPKKNVNKGAKTQLHMYPKLFRKRKNMSIEEKSNGFFAADGNENGWTCQFIQSLFIPNDSQHIGEGGNNKVTDGNLLLFLVGVVTKVFNKSKITVIWNRIYK